MKRVYVDFESRSEADIYEVGAWNYACHPSTEILCLAYAIDNGPVVVLRMGKQLSEGLHVLNALVREGAEFHAHNAFFERCIWFHKLNPYYGASPIAIKQWRCTAAKAMANALPKSLENVAKALGCKHQKDMSGHKVMMQLARSKGPIPQDKLERLCEYCAIDVETEREIDQRLPDLDEKEQKVWFLDQYINDNGVCVDLDAVHKAVEIIESETGVLTEELQLLTNGEVNAGTQRDAIKSFLEKKGLNLPNLQKKTISDALAGDQNKLNRRILELRQKLSLTSNAKYNTLLTATSNEGRIRDMLVYHGASTGRWAGKLVQVQNLPKPPDLSVDYTVAISVLKTDKGAFRMLYDDVLGTLSGCIRGMFVPSPSCDMFTTDFSAIEARVVLWLAGETKGLSLFHDQDNDPSKPDIYVYMARQIYGNDKLTKKDKAARQLGKQATLGCGFGMGHVKFKATCETYGIIIDEALAQRAVNGYRQTFPKVKAFWYDMETAAKRCVLTGKTQQVGHILWFMDGEFLRMKLPRGRNLAYHRPKVMEDQLSFMGTNPVTKRYVPESTWGGSLVENCLTRDTKVLTISGVKDIINIQQGDKVWDGENWVTTGGIVKRGIKETGELRGIRCTPDHLIRVGNLWKKAIDLDEGCWQDALSPGLSSVASACLKAEPVMTADLYVDVLANVFCLSKLGTLSEGKALAPDVHTIWQVLNGRNTLALCQKIRSISGATDIPGWSRDAIIGCVQRTLITAVGVFKSIRYGLKIGKRFLNTLKHCPDGIIQPSTWTALITTAITSPETCVSVADHVTRETDERLLIWFITTDRSRIWTSGSVFAQVGKATTRWLGTYLKVKQQNRLWHTTGKQEEVYDLLNCGPNNCFTILSAEGPIVVHNCTQAVARDIMVEAMMQMVVSGSNILFTVHDELVTEAPEGTVSVEDILKIVRTVPSWAAGCPINAECEKVTRYKK